MAGSVGAPSLKPPTRRRVREPLDLAETTRRSNDPMRTAEQPSMANDQILDQSFLSLMVIQETLRHSMMMDAKTHYSAQTAVEQADPRWIEEKRAAESADDALIKQLAERDAAKSKTEIEAAIRSMDSQPTASATATASTPADGDGSSEPQWEDDDDGRDTMTDDGSRQAGERANQGAEVSGVTV